ncbi:MAG: T9SS type A sorting domain-containing protein [Bacteroidetes bacterium]|nr:T9SS type A sorting domain-containing protein [Bacteroidota bacterium]
MISFNIWYETSGALDGAVLEASTDYGTTWTLVESGASSQNWSDAQMLGYWSGSSAGWIEASNTIYDLAGEPVVKFRFSFIGPLYGSQEGVAVDDIAISECTLPDPSAGFTYTLNGTTATFTNTSTYATDYLWDFGMFQTSEEQNPVHDFMIDGSYTVTLYAYNACGVDSITQIVDIVTGISGVRNFGVAVYPNPVSQELNISFAGAIAPEWIHIFDLQGREVYSDYVPGMRHRIIPADWMESGVYTLRIVTARNVLTSKIIVE